MKGILFVFAGIVLWTELSVAQFIKPKDVPNNIKVSLDSLFPEIKTPIWKKVGLEPNEKNKYEATATYNNQRIWVTLGEAGDLYVLEKAINKDMVPEYVDEYISKHHPWCQINDSRKIFLSEKNLYLIIINSGRIYYSLLFDEDGSCLGDKSNLVAYMTSFVAASFQIPDIGQFKPFKIRDRLATAPTYDFKSDKKP